MITDISIILKSIFQVPYLEGQGDRTQKGPTNFENNPQLHVSLYTLRNPTFPRNPSLNAHRPHNFENNP